MSTIRVDQQSPDPAAIEQAAAVLRAGGLVAFPTETVYGLGANALDSEAVARIFAAKGRPSYNPLIVHVHDAAVARALAAAWPAGADACADSFWPGPLTLVVARAPHVPDAVTAGLPTVAIRVPAHPVARALLKAAEIPVAAPSANRSTELSPTLAEHVQKSLGGKVDLILDAGPTPVGIESTVIDLSGSAPVLLRPGSLSQATLERVLGPLMLSASAGHSRDARPSPGMLDRHYAPQAELRLFTPCGVLDVRPDYRVGALLLSCEAMAHHKIRMPGDPESYAQRLYAELHSLDDAGCDLILVERVPETAEWAGVRDRLNRAARRG
ncbi:MAG: threonylcarbamoyl-AMP synthase [Gemmatimonadetes bacterium]|nr:threonylcarbamoyl-AMP synthase [Gemmatimonadota bacterium]